MAQLRRNQNVSKVYQDLEQKEHTRAQYAEFLKMEGLTYKGEAIPTSFIPLILPSHFIARVTSDLHIAFKLAFSFLYDPENREHLRRTGLSRFYIDHAKVLDTIPKTLYGSARVDSGLEGILDENGAIKIFEFNMSNCGGWYDSQITAQHLTALIPELTLVGKSFTSQTDYFLHLTRSLTQKSGPLLVVSDEDSGSHEETDFWQRGATQHGVNARIIGEKIFSRRFLDGTCTFNQGICTYKGETYQDLLVLGYDREEKVFGDEKYHDSTEVIRALVASGCEKYDSHLQRLLDDKTILIHLSNPFTQQKYLTPSEEKRARVIFPHSYPLNPTKVNREYEYVLKRGHSCGGKSVDMDGGTTLSEKAQHEPLEWILQQKVEPAEMMIEDLTGRKKRVELAFGWYVTFMVQREPFHIKTNLVGAFIRGGKGIINIARGGYEIPAILGNQ